MQAALLALSIPASPRPVLIQDATFLSAAELAGLDGQTVRVRAEPATEPTGGLVELDWPTAAGWTAEWATPGDGPRLLEGRLSVLRHRAGVTAGGWFPRFTEFRLRQARVAR